jgi:hypothetical protein
VRLDDLALEYKKQHPPHECVMLVKRDQQMSLTTYCWRERVTALLVSADAELFEEGRLSCE